MLSMHAAPCLSSCRQICTFNQSVVLILPALQIGLAVAVRFKRDGHAVLLEWQRIACWQRRCKAVLQQAAGRLKHRSLSLAMEEWQYQTWKARAVRRAALFVQNHTLVAAYNSWKALHEICLLERAVAKFTQITTSK